MRGPTQEQYDNALDIVVTLARDIVPLRRLVFAARRVAFEDRSEEAIRELDVASEAFADVFPWKDDPEHELDS